ncbi:hypothetical protein FBALC1_14832 [Flavobacteriales bacterium ALC-1]|nr:hypothetical protein FBALC1_14832 [Flavobacteriales bacterium ALC-1]
MRTQILLVKLCFMTIAKGKRLFMSKVHGDSNKLTIIHEVLYMNKKDIDNAIQLYYETSKIPSYKND